MANFRAHNPDNYEVIKKLQLFVRPRGSSGPWESFGSIKDVAIRKEDQPLEHFSNYLGARVKDREETIERRCQIDFTFEEFNSMTLKHALGHGWNASSGGSPVKDALFEKTVVNPGSAQTISLGKTAIKNVVVRSIGLEAPVTYVEGAGNDYTVNLATGVITILAGGDLENAGTVPKVHVSFQQERDVEEFELFPGRVIELEAQLQYGASGQVEKIYGPITNAILKNNGDISIGDGSDWAGVPMRIEGFAAADGTFGTVGLVKETQS